MSTLKKKVGEEVEEVKEKVSVANTEKIAMANELLAHQFNIDETFSVNKVVDKGNSLTLGFENSDYEVVIKIKDVIEMGIIVQ